MSIMVIKTGQGLIYNLLSLKKYSCITNIVLEPKWRVHFRKYEENTFVETVEYSIRNERSFLFFIKA